MSVRPSVRMQQLDLDCMAFIKFDIWWLFRKSVEKIQVSLKPDNNNGYFRWIPMYIYIKSCSVAPRMGNVSCKRYTENQNILCSLSFFLKLCRLWECGTILQSGAGHMTICRMRIACWIPKATNILSKYVIFIASHCNSGYTNASQYYVIHTLPVLLISCQVAYRVKVTVSHSIERPHTKRNVDANNKRSLSDKTEVFSQAGTCQYSYFCFIFTHAVC
jgi:hypothetical protein